MPRAPRRPPSEGAAIVIRGARQHNLSIPELSIPKKQLVVLTGPSGSGKSSLAFDTIYAEGQRRYVESLSSYARQFLGQLEKPAYDHIRGLSPTVAIEQKAASANPRSTVGTITEILDYLRVLYARVGTQHCVECGKPVRALSTDEVVARLREEDGMLLFLAPQIEHRKGAFGELFDALRRDGFARARVDGEVVRLEGLGPLDKRRKHSIELVVDRLDPRRTERQRVADSVETALDRGGGTMLAVRADGAELRMSRSRSCCGRGYPEPTPQWFSFNSPVGMCPTCNGLGHVLEMDPDLVVPDHGKSLRGGALVPFASILARGEGWSFSQFDALERECGVPLDVPWRELSDEQRALVLHGAGDRRFKVQWSSKHGQVSWATRYEGVLPTLMRRYRETKSEQMQAHYRQFLSDQPCADCGGARLRPEPRAVRIGGLSIVELCALSVAEARAHLEALEVEAVHRVVAGELLGEVRARLEFLHSVGLDYLSLDRSGPTLSGGEAQRIRLASQLGSELSGVIYVLDEPSIGLHQRDNERLIETLRRLRDNDNSVLVVEHDADTIEAADHVIDFGPGAGRQGGRVVFEGPPAALLAADTLTGRYLSRRLRVDPGAPRRTPAGWLTVRGATAHNLKDVTVRLPLGVLAVVTGVSGAGKSTLVTGIVHPALARRLHGAREPVGTHRRIDGVEQLDKVILVDQTPIGRTPRSNPATYTKCFDHIREVFAMTPDARARGFSAGRFSFNVAGGRCEACSGDGVKKVEMHFLPDVYVPCEVCGGRRYDEATLSVRYRDLSIHDVLELPVSDARDVFEAHPRIARVLSTLVEVGLDYVHLGQPAPTLSGGEAQRVKLSRELSRRDTGRTLYVLDEPTTGLHFDDIRRLLLALRRLVDAGNSVLVIEHNLDVIRAADWVTDMGPEGGAAGGRVVAEGPPERVMEAQGSHTAEWLRRTAAAPQRRRARAH